MAKKIFVGVNDVARRVKRIYVGVNGVARRVTKVYVGVNNIARLAFASDKVDVDGLRYPVTQLAGASVGNYALFAGGLYASAGEAISKVNAYNTSLTRSSPTPLSFIGSRLTGVGGSWLNYALFAGGSANKKVDAYNTSLTRTSATNLSVSGDWMAGATAYTVAIFAGGHITEGDDTTVSAYTKSLTKKVGNLRIGREELAGASVGNYALFAGGYASNGDGVKNYVEALDTSLTRTSATGLSAARHSLAGASVGGPSKPTYALFAGGEDASDTLRATVNAYDTSLTRTSATGLSVARKTLTGVSTKKYAVFAGGYLLNYKWSDVVDVYDSSLTRSTATRLSKARDDMAGASVGNYALFAGGSDGLSIYDGLNTVDAYDTTNF